jgi:hypothetical protein
MGVGVTVRRFRRRLPMLVSNPTMSMGMSDTGQGFIGADEASDAREQRAKKKCAAGFDKIGHAQLSMSETFSRHLSLTEWFSALQ